MAQNKGRRPIASLTTLSGFTRHRLLHQLKGASAVMARRALANADQLSHFSRNANFVAAGFASCYGSWLN
jgi:hypothetical protein